MSTSLLCPRSPIAGCPERILAAGKHELLREVVRPLIVNGLATPSEQSPMKDWQRPIERLHQAAHQFWRVMNDPELTAMLGGASESPFISNP
jgi:hypothetical protein